jgi:hypothetical protein
LFKGESLALQLDPLWTPRKEEGDARQQRKRRSSAGGGGGSSNGAQAASAPRQQPRGWTPFTTYGLEMREVVRAEHPGATATAVEKVEPAYATICCLL